MKKILLINPFGIGDVLFTTPVIRAVKESIPDSYIGYWCNERVSPIVRGNPALNKIFALNRGDIKRIARKSWLGETGLWYGLLRDIKREKFDVCFDFSLDYRYGLISKLAGIGKRIGFNYKNRGRFLTDRVNIDGYGLKHIIEYYGDLPGMAGIPMKSREMSLPLSEKTRRAAKEIFHRYGIGEKNKVIGISAGGGASWGKDAGYKHWPAANFAGLINKINKDIRADIVLLGDEREKKIADRIAGAADRKVVNLAGNTGLEELCGVISCLDLLVTNDGGPLHIAAASGIKTVSIFGPVDELVYGPYPKSDKHKTISRHLSCQPCYINFRFKGCPNNRKCLEDITVDEVLAGIKELLK
ncbi:MAG: lipopolysaccharide heptosyltransferase II [Candidatus Omnitrophica bacterium]|nr:lipopolysaccharide heptosyltransferase II [Candidatus Omnitrophota bacterium]